MALYHISEQRGESSQIKGIFLNERKLYLYLQINEVHTRACISFTSNGTSICGAISGIVHILHLCRE